MTSSPYINRFLSADSIVLGYANPQSLNRFSYVQNNPIRFTDPSGHKIVEDAGVGGPCKNIECELQSSNSGNQPKPKTKPNNGSSCGQPGIYSSDCPGWHSYQTTNIVCPAEWNCTEEQMKDFLSRFAFPGQGPAEPVIGWRLDAVTDPWYGILPKEIGLIITEVSPDGLSVTNTTRPGHILHDGKIVRTISQVNGTWIVTTYGYGNNISPVFDAQRPDLPPINLPSLALVNIWGGIPIFDEVDRQMKDYIETNR